MAHGDYECCAICDRKMAYIGLNDNFKTDVCPECRVRTGISTVSQLKEKINSFKNKQSLKRFLKQIEFRECYYQNDVDDLVAYKLTGAVPDKFKSASEFVKSFSSSIKD